MKRAGKAKLPPHVLAAVEEKARLRRIDERAHFWSEVESARTGVGGARSHGRCLPDAEEDLFPGSFEDVEDADASEASAASSRAGARRAEIEAAYDDIPVKIWTRWVRRAALRFATNATPSIRPGLDRRRLLPDPSAVPGRPARRRRAGGAIGRRRRRWCRPVVRRRGGFETNDRVSIGVRDAHADPAARRPARARGPRPRVQRRDGIREDLRVSRAGDRDGDRERNDPRFHETRDERRDARRDRRGGRKIRSASATRAGPAAVAARGRRAFSVDGRARLRRA